MVELAKYMEIYQGAPDVVSRGKQALVKVFADDIKTQWAKSDTASGRLLSEMETSILKLVINMNVTGRIPSVKQAKVVLKTRERLISEGMPMQFS